MATPWDCYHEYYRVVYDAPKAEAYLAGPCIRGLDKFMLERMLKTVFEAKEKTELERLSSVWGIE